MMFVLNCIQKDGLCWFAAPGGVFVQMKGIAGLFDPVVCDWLTYLPSSVKSSSGEEPDTENKVFLNPSIAQATDPLKQSTMAGK